MWSSHICSSALDPIKDLRIMEGDTWKRQRCGWESPSEAGNGSHYLDLYFDLASFLPDWPDSFWPFPIGPLSESALDLWQRSCFEPTPLGTGRLPSRIRINLGSIGKFRCFIGNYCNYILALSLLSVAHSLYCSSFLLKIIDHKRVFLSLYGGWQNSFRAVRENLQSIC